MPDEKSAKPQAPKKRRWLRRLGYSFLTFLLLIVAFHRPIIHNVGRWAAIWFAKRQHMALDLRIKGDIWHRVEVHNVSLHALDARKAPLERATLDHLAVEYDFWRIVKGDLGGLKLVDLGTANVVVAPPLEVDLEPPQPLAVKVRAFFSRPLPMPVARVGRVDLRVKDKFDEIVVRGARLDFNPGTEGIVAWERVEVPGIPVIEAGSARVLATGHEILISDAAVWPEVKVTSLRAVRPHGDTRAELTLDVALPDGKLSATLVPIIDSKIFEAHVKLETRGIDALAPRFGLTMPMVLENLALDANWRGIPEEAGASSGDVIFSASGRKDLVLPGWAFSGRASLQEGRLTLANTEFRAAETVLAVSGTLDARKTLAHQGRGRPPLPEGKLDLRLSAPDLQRAAAEFNQQLRGQAELAGTLTTVADAAAFKGTLTGKELGYRDTSIGAVTATVTAQLPMTDAPPLTVLSANLAADMSDFHSGDIRADRVQLTAEFRQLQATITDLVVTRGANRAQVAGSVRLRENGQLAGAPTARFSIDAPRVEEFGFKAGERPLTGAVRGTGSFTLENGKISGTTQLNADQLVIGDTIIDGANANVSVEGGVTTAKSVIKRGENELQLTARTVLNPEGGIAEPPVIDFTLIAPSVGEFGVKVGEDTLTGAARGSGTVTIKDGRPTGVGKFTGSGIAIGETQLGDVDLKASAVNGLTSIDATVKRGRNELQVRSQILIGPDAEQAEPPTIQFAVDAPTLGEFAFKIKGAPVAGTLKGTGSVKLVKGVPEGSLNVTASNLTIGAAKAGGVVVDAVAENGALVVKTLRAQFNASDYLEASGRMDWKEPRPYQGAVSLNVRDLAAFQPILEALGEKRRLGGSVQLKWNGKGDMSAHRGDGNLTTRALRVDTLEITEGKLTATYNPERVDIPEFLVIADQLRATGKLDWVNKRLSLRNLEVQLSGKPVITGDLSTPLDPFGKSVLPDDQPISASIAARNLELGRIARELKLPPRAEGTLTATLTGSGTLKSPVVKLDASGRGIRLSPPPKTEMTDEQRAVYNTARGDFDAAAGVEGGRFTLNGTIRHSDVKPLTVKLEAPLELKPIFEGKMPDFQAIPFKASLEMPSSSLAVVPKLTPAVTRVDGAASISIQATGTIREPRLSGQVVADARSIRLANGSIPPISNLVVRIGLAGNTVTVQRFEGETGGGRFSVGGTVIAANLLEPLVDLRVRTDKVLAMRNDSVLVRVDSDIQLRGPFHAGTATGRVVLAQSRFNKEIQILPILMPGRPKPVPREVSQPTVISFPDPPLRDWKFDIAIVTTNEDPFLVRGNLAKGQVIVDLRLQGTGLEPYLVGSASMDQFTAQLPVSRLTTRRGVINFSRENPFEPRLEIESETVIRGYTIIARLEGPASAPRLDLTSEPPLPQQEIMTLLTTGSMAGELGENNTALATRAGLIVLRDLYKKVFKHDLPVPSGEGGDNFFGRFTVDLGAVDSRTGRQEITTQFRVTDRVVVVADVEMGGGVSGRIQYLFRFR